MPSLFQKMTLRGKITLYFSLGFLSVWIVVTLLFFATFKNTLLNAFDDQMRERALVIAQKTNIYPRMIPITQGDELFAIFSTSYNDIDTLFLPQDLPFDFPISAGEIRQSPGWRSVRIEYKTDEQNLLEVVYALPTKGIDNKLDKLTGFLIIMLIFCFLLTVVISYWLASKLLKPIQQVIHSANAISLYQHNLQLLPEQNSESELRDLVQSFNRMLLRIKEQADKQTAFFASASHELRTPLTILQTSLQVSSDEADKRNHILYTELLKQVQRLIKMTNEFLLMSELRIGNMQVVKSQLNLSDIISEQVAFYKSKADEKGIRFKVLYEPMEANFDAQADEQKLQIIFSNLLDNAIKYSPDKSTVEICLHNVQDTCKVYIRNPIRSDIRPKITELKKEFYHSKPQHTEGFGLGLWIANQLAQIQGFSLCFSIDERGYFVATFTC